MSLITQCPACATMFKVVPDQLRISDGWVRCGQCDEVFDANAHLYSDPGQSGGAVTQAPEPAGTQDVDWRPSQDVAADESDPLSPLVDVAVEVEDAVMVDMQHTQHALQDVDEARLDEVPDIAAVHTLDPLLDLRPGHVGDESMVAGAARSSVDVAAPVAPPRFAQMHIKTVDVADTPTLSFMRQARGRSVWQRTSVRALLSLAVVVLMAGLVLQVVVHERDRIAATEPAAKEALLAVCAWLDCKVQPVRQIESVVIDSSSFTKVRADVYRLNFTLKSTAAIAVAVPALELTLTDMQDQAVVRRVLLASELGAGKDILEAGTELSTALPISVKPGSSAERISGYRLLAFYP